ncbi:hypothetical protein Aperf_G00000085133 [Anoplocephala perfoliata]
MDRSSEKERRASAERAKVASPLKKHCSNSRDQFSNNSENMTLTSALAPHARVAFDELPKSSGRFKHLAAIVNHMKMRHLEGDHHALSIHEILEEVSLSNQPTSLITWLTREALPNNAKISMTPDGKFVFKPRYNIHNRSELYQLLRKHEIEGLGGVEFEDIAECMKDADKVVKSLGDTVYDYTNPYSKKRVIYFNDTRFDLKLDEKFKELWRSSSVVGVSEQDVEEYLDKHGLKTMSAEKTACVSNPATTNHIKFNRKIAARHRKPRSVVLKHNEHVKDMLIDYPENKPPGV